MIITHNYQLNFPNYSSLKPFSACPLSIGLDFRTVLSTVVSVNFLIRVEEFVLHFKENVGIAIVFSCTSPNTYRSVREYYNIVSLLL